MALYARVIVPVPLPTLLTYRIPPELSDAVRPLHRVVVGLGPRRTYTAIVVDVSDTKDGDYDVRDIIWCGDTEPVIRRTQLRLWEWMSEYYMCAIGDVMRAALPAALKLESDTLIMPLANGGAESGSNLLPLPDISVQMVWEAIAGKEKMWVRDLERAGLKNVMPSVYALMERGMVSISERVSERFHAKREEYYRLTIPRGDDEAVKNAFGRLRSERHQRLLMTLLDRSDFMRRGAELREVSRESIASEECFDRAILRSFVKKGFIEIENRVVSRFRWNERPLKPVPELSSAQRTALDEIHRQMAEQSVVLLHGVTSSGKTEIYIHLIDFVLRQGRQVLFLVPEIALTTQLTERLQDVFGPKVLVYHSRFSDSERVEVWNYMLQHREPVVVVGARSSVFLPFDNLGLVIIDEEHEQSYKQFDPAPRYNGRDVAMVLANMCGAKTLLGSATPSVETFYKAQTGKFGLVELTERYGNVALPEIEIVDMNKAAKKGEVRNSLALRTVDLARNALNDGRQVIVFHNRRGFSPLARCKGCEYVPKCTDCDVSLTYHKRIDRLVCHYCGKEYVMPDLCPVCSQPTVGVVGYGTERVEDAVAEAFPGARSLRMDLDTTRNKEDYTKIIDEFSANKADIFIGTQMVTKGLDFGNVSTVAVLNADMIINYPDFHSTERAFDMLEQVAGRAGRRADMPGRVVVQTRQPEHGVLRYVVSHDYKGFYDYELEQRRQYNYPPFTRIIYINVRHKNEAVCKDATDCLAVTLRGMLGNRIFGPHEPTVNRVKTYYIRRIMVKVENGVSMLQVKNILNSAVTEVRSHKEFRSCDVYFDVDPL